MQETHVNTTEGLPNTGYGNEARPATKTEACDILNEYLCPTAERDSPGRQVGSGV
jgi:hypothetical protein